MGCSCLGLVLSDRRAGSGLLFTQWMLFVSNRRLRVDRYAGPIRGGPVEAIRYVFAQRMTIAFRPCISLLHDLNGQTVFFLLVLPLSDAPGAGRGSFGLG